MQSSTKRFVIDCKNTAFYEKQIEFILNISGKQLSTHFKSKWYYVSYDWNTFRGIRSR